MSLPDPDPSFQPAIGEAQEIQPGVRRIVAPNPSPMTFRGTNTYLVGDRGIAVIDPGPQSDVHLNAILSALGPGQEVTHIVVTHAHLDHSPLASELSRLTGAPVVAYGDAQAGRSSVMTTLSKQGPIGGGEGVDSAFRPDEIVDDGACITGENWTLDVVHTPGHFGNHIALGFDDMLFSGDLVMGWASSLVSPPDGDLTDFMASCSRLKGLRHRHFLPGHGAMISTPQDRLDWLIGHRRGREAAILEAIEKAPGTASEIAQKVYTDTPPAFLPAATRNVLAHLIDLHVRDLVTVIPPLSANAIFRLR